MKLGRLSGNVLALLAVAAGQSEAAEPAFTNSFDDITSGASVSLTWDGIAPQHYPLCVTAQVIERGGDGYKANSYRVNITSTFASILGFFEDGGPSRVVDGWMDGASRSPGGSVYLLPRGEIPRSVRRRALGFSANDEISRRQRQLVRMGGCPISAPLDKVGVVSARAKADELARGRPAVAGQVAGF
jgi:hypothetical protein